MAFRISKSCLLLCALVLSNGGLHADVPPLDSVRSDLNQGRADQGLRTLGQVLQQQPQNAEAQNLRCRILMQEQRWDNAIAACQSAATIEPGNSDYHLWLARALGEKADRVSFITAFKMARQVRQEFEAAARLDPSNPEALSDLAEFYVDAPSIVGGGLDKAEKTAAQLTAIAPDRGHYIRARIAEDRKDYVTAEQEYKAAIATAKNPGEAWIDLASFYRRRQRLGDMASAIHSGADADKKRGIAFADGATLLIRTGRELPYARQLLEQYLASPNKSEEAPAFQVYVRLGKLLAQLGDTQSANQQFAAAQALAKDYQAGSQATTNSGR